VALLSLVVVGSALAFGAVHVPALLVLAGVLGLGFGFALFKGTVRRGLPLPALLLLGLAAYSALQSLPLPAALVSWLSPDTASDWLSAHELVGAPAPHWLSLSLEPAASRLEALKWGVYAVTFALAAGLPSHVWVGPFELRRQVLGAGLAFLSAVSVAAVTLAHRLLGATHVYGFYRPIGEVTRTSIGPLMNPNNLAGYLNLGVFCGLGLVLSMRSWPLRAIAGLGLAALLGTALETGSRGGFVALAVGLLAFAFMAWWKRGHRFGSARQALGLTFGIALAGCILAALAVGPNFASHFSDRSLDKLAMASWVVPLIRDHLWVGVGRGAFEAAFQQYRIGESNLIYSHPENFVVQWVAEWGVLVGALALVACLAMFRPKRLAAFDSFAALGVIVGVGAVLLQNLVDLGLEVPAVSIAVVMVLASCWGSVADNRAAWTRPWVAWVATGALFVGMAVSASEPETGGDARRRIDASLDALVIDDAPALAAFRSQLQAALLQHPADPYFPRIGAVVALRKGEPNALAWVNQALELGLQSGRTHYLLAQALALHGYREQALLELRHAATYDPDLDAHIAERALSLTRDPEALKRVAPRSTSGRKLLSALARAFKGPAEAPQRIVLLRAALERDPGVLRSYLDLGGELLAAATSSPPLPPCAANREACLADIRSLGEAATRVAPDSSAGAELLARLALATNDPASAVQILAQPCARVAVRRSCMLLRLQAALAAKKAALASDVARELARQDCVGAEECAHLFQEIANLFAGAGSYEVALSYFEMAAREDPTDARWLRVADAASQAGHYALALSSLQKVERRPGAEPRLRKRIEAVKAAMLQQASEAKKP
jgi:tetratricopeptide (TPR) repeat protein